MLCDSKRKEVYIQMRSIVISGCMALAISPVTRFECVVCVDRIVTRIMKMNGIFKKELIVLLQHDVSILKYMK